MVERPPDAPHRPLPRALVALAAVIALAEIVLQLSDRGLIADPSLRNRLYVVGAFWTGLVHGAAPIFPLQPYTMFLSHALLHGNLLHMAMNTAVLLGLGRFVTDRYGPGALLPTFVIGAVGGGAAFALLSAGPAPMVGASGAIFAFVGVWTVWDWRSLRERGAPVRPVVVRTAALAALNAAAFVGLDGMLAWEAHLGGFLAGLVIGAALESRSQGRARRARTAARARRDGGAS